MAKSLIGCFLVRGSLLIFSLVFCLDFKMIRSCHAAATTSATTPFVLPGMMASQPAVPDMNSLNQAMVLAGQQMATMNACFSAQMGAGILGQSCASSESIQFPSGSTDLCLKFTGPDGFNQALWQQEMMRVQSAVTGGMCQKAQLGALQSQLSCVQEKQSMLIKQVGTLQDAFVKNIQRMKKDIQSLFNAEADRIAQIDDVKMKLGDGGGREARDGMVYIQEKMTNTVNKDLPSEMESTQNSIKDLQIQKKGVDQYILGQKMSLVSDCFNQNASNVTAGRVYRCIPNGPPVSPREYVLCRYEQNHQIGQEGVIEQDALLAKQSRADAQALESLLNTIFNDVPKGVPAGNEQAVSSEMSRSYRVQSIGDFDRYYGSALQKYNGQGLDIRSFVMGTIKKCYQTADQVVEAKRTKPTTDVGAMITGYQKSTLKLKTSMGTFIEKYAQLYDEGIRALTGNSMPLPGVDVCKNANPETGLKCMDDLKKNIEGLLTGRVPQSRMNIFIKGINTSNYIPIQCMGLNGCVRVLTNVKTSLELEKKRLETFKKDYILTANQQIEGFVRSMANQFSPQSAEIQNGLQSLGSRLGALGVRGLSPKAIQGKGLEGGGEELYQVPGDIYSLIGAQMNPPMVDLSEAGISEALQDVSEKFKKIDKDVSKAQEYAQKLNATPIECKKKNRDAFMKKLEEDVGKANDCAMAKVACDAIDYNELQNLVESLEEAGIDTSLHGSDQSEDLDLSSSLSHGMNLCNTGGNVDALSLQTQQDNINSYLTEMGNAQSAEDQLKKAKEFCGEAYTFTSCDRKLRSDLVDVRKEMSSQFDGQSISGCGGISRRITKDVEVLKSMGSSSNESSTQSGD